MIFSTLEKLKCKKTINVKNIFPWITLVAVEEDPCMLPKETGLCKAHFKRFYYNSVDKECQPFVYGGCKGNKNNFVLKSACESKCAAKVAINSNFV